MTRLLIVVAALVASTGCGVSGGILRDSNTVNRFDYHLNLNGVRYVRSAQGMGQVGSALCVIPLGDSMYADAMRELHANARLQENEVLTNMREDKTRIAYLGFYCITKVIISADVIHLIPYGATTPPPLLPNVP